MAREEKGFTAENWADEAELVHVSAGLEGSEATSTASSGISLAQQALAYQVDFWQRSVLFLDALRERANNLFAHDAITALREATSGPKGLVNWNGPQGERFSGIRGATTLSDGRGVDFYLSVDRHRDAMLLNDTLESTMLAVPLLLVLVLVGGGAGVITRTGLAPLRRFNQLVSTVGARTLDQRISMAGLPRELAELASAFNAMLARIDAGYRQLEEFAGDLAHEMRTPVATLLARTQVALSKARTADQLREVLEGNVEELERLKTLITDMLFIARADHEVNPVQGEPVDLLKEAHSVAEFMSLGTDDKSLRLDVPGNAPRVPADRSMVQRAITNLRSNAVRHAIEGSEIVIEIGSRNGYCTISVSNVGESIPVEKIIGFSSVSTASIALARGGTAERGSDLPSCAPSRISTAGKCRREAKQGAAPSRSGFPRKPGSLADLSEIGRDTARMRGRTPSSRNGRSSEAGCNGGD